MNRSVRCSAFVLATSVALGLVGVACRPANMTHPANPSANSAGSSTNRQTYEVKGVVKEVMPERKKAKIAHEEIPGYMEAMTMLLDVKDAAELKDLQAGDNIMFRMVVLENDGWIENIRKLDGPRTPLPADPPLRRAAIVEALGVGDAVPEYTFTNMLGQVVKLSELKGRAVGFTFIFTRCPFPTFCPRMNMNFAAAYKQLSEMPNAATNWHLMSISFDPDHDTPKRLAEYSAMYKPNPEKWSWMTGAMIDIDAITEQVGLVFSFEKGTFVHNLRTVVVDKNGIIRQNLRGNEWKPEDLVNEIIAGAEGKEVVKD